MTGKIEGLEQGSRLRDLKLGTLNKWFSQNLYTNDAADELTSTAILEFVEQCDVDSSHTLNQEHCGRHNFRACIARCLPAA